MKNKLTVPSISAALMIGGLVSVPAAAENVNATIGVTNNFVWRGVTQTQNGPAVQGGLDYQSETGIYASVWASNVDFGGDNDFGNQYQLDGYVGWNMDFTDNLGLDIGYIYSHYGLIENGSDFGELYVSVNLWRFEFGVAATVNDQKSKADEDAAPFVAGDHMLWGAIAIPFGENWSTSLTAGQYNFKNDGATYIDDFALVPERVKAGYNYAWYQIDITKSTGEYGDITMSASQAGKQADGNDNPKIFISWAKGF